MPRPEIRRASPARQGEDGHYHLTGHWKGRPMPIYEGERPAVSIALVRDAGETGDPVKLWIQAFRPDGTAQTSGSEATFSPGQGCIYDFAFNFTDPAQIHRVTVKVHEKDAPENSTELTLELYSGDYARFGTEGAGGASEAQIEALQAQVPHPLCEDHLDFLRRVNGRNYVWWQGPDWNTQDAFFTALSEAGEKEDIGFLSDVTALFGLGSDLPSLGYADDLGQMGFFEPWFLDYVIPVGVDGGGNLIMQALTSERRGRIFFYDHEYHYGFVEEVQEAIRKEGAHMFWKIMEEEALLPCADDFAQMTDRLHAYHTGLMDKLARFRLV